MAGHEVDVDAPVPQCRDGGEPDRPAADDQHPIAGVDHDAPRGVGPDRQRFDQRADRGVDARSQRYQAATVDDHLVGQAAVDRHAVQAARSDAAELGLAREAAVARTAPRVRLHRDGTAVVEHARELMPERDRQVPRRQVQVRRADAARPHAHPHRIGGVVGRVRLHLHHRDPSVARRPHRSHRPSLAAGRRPCRVAVAAERSPARRHYGVTAATDSAATDSAWSDDGGSRFRRQGGDRHRCGRRPRTGAFAPPGQQGRARGRQRRRRRGRRQRQRRGTGTARRRRDHGRGWRSGPRHELGRDARGWRRDRADRARHASGASTSW